MGDGVNDQGRWAAARGVPHRLHTPALAVAIAGGFAMLASFSAAPATDPAVKAAPRTVQAQLVRAELSGRGLEDAVAQGLEAEERNEALAFMSGPVEKMPGIAARAAMGASYDNAQKCLAQAIYYEAATEPELGQRAVAQVVLNRMRHPAYPSTVCGVVYEGWSRRVCQFSFTCDGSLRRQPMASLWAQSNRIAREMLGGKTEPSVGSATHYHADYVFPGWATKLGKLAQIGRHIFYRFPNAWGRAGAFTQGWRGVEAIPSRQALLARVEDLPLPVEELATTDSFTPGLTVAPDVQDRHAPADVGGRIDTTKEWRLSIPDPVAAPGAYRQALASQGDEPVLQGAMLSAAGNTDGKITQ